VLGNEGAGVIEDAGGSGLAEGSRVMFTGLYGVAESGAWQDWLLVRPEHLALVPDAIDDVVAASLPVAYLTAARNDASALPFWPCGGPTKRGAHPFF
jgi:NADPH:quinone reductase-like Zn-dependent oxidoreductase